MRIQIIIIQLKFLNFYQNCEHFIFLLVISHLEQYVFSKINAIEGCSLNIRQELETLDDTNDKEISPPS